MTDVSDTTYIIFKVMACNDAHVLLYEDEDDVHNNLYEIVLGKSFDITKTCPCNIQQYFTAIKMIIFR